MEKITTEILNFKRQNILSFEKMLYEREPLCNSINNSFSGILVIGDSKTFVWKWLPKDFIEKYDIDLQKDQRLSTLEFIIKYVHPMCLPISAAKIVQCKLRAPNEPFEIMECARPNPTIPYKWYHKTMKFSKINNCIISIVHEVNKEAINSYPVEESFRIKNFDKFSKLTARQKEVLALLALGKTNKEVAAVLNISVNTVRTFRNQIHRTLELRWKNLNYSQTYSRYAQEFGLIEC